MILRHLGQHDDPRQYGSGGTADGRRHAGDGKRRNGQVEPGDHGLTEMPEGRATGRPHE